MGAKKKTKSKYTASSGSKKSKKSSKTKSKAAKKNVKTKARKSQKKTKDKILDIKPPEPPRPPEPPKPNTQMPSVDETPPVPPSPTEKLEEDSSRTEKKGLFGFFRSKKHKPKENSPKKHSQESIKDKAKSPQKLSDFPHYKDYLNELNDNLGVETSPDISIDKKKDKDKQTFDKNEEKQVKTDDEEISRKEKSLKSKAKPVEENIQLKNETEGGSKGFFSFLTKNKKQKKTDSKESIEEITKKPALDDENLKSADSISDPDQKTIIENTHQAKKQNIPNDKKQLDRLIKEYEKKKQMLDQKEQYLTAQQQQLGLKEKEIEKRSKLVQKNDKEHRRSADEHEKKIESLRTKAQIEKERLEKINFEINKKNDELKGLIRQSREAKQLIDKKDKYFDKEYKKIEALRKELEEKIARVDQQEKKYEKIKQIKSEISEVHGKLTDEMKEELKHKKNLNGLMQKEKDINLKISEKESEIARKEYELNEREKLLEEKSNALLQLQNDLIKEKHLIEEKRFNSLMRQKQEPNKPEPSKVIRKVTPSQVYHMISQASELIAINKYSEAQHLYNLIYDYFQKLNLSKEEKLSMELSINNLYNDLNLAILNQQ